MGDRHHAGDVNPRLCTHNLVYEQKGAQHAEIQIPTMASCIRGMYMNCARTVAGVCANKFIAFGEPYGDASLIGFVKDELATKILLSTVHSRLAHM